MKFAHNPYNWQKVNIELFFGRMDLADEISSDLIKGQSFALTGGRKMGKTTLLRFVENDLIAQKESLARGGFLLIPVYVDTLSLKLDLDPDKLLQLIAQNINKQIASRLDTKDAPKEFPVSVARFEDYLLETQSNLSKYRIQIIFLIDEIEPILNTEWGKGFFSYLRHLLQNCSMSSYLSAIFSGASEMDEIARDIGSPLSNILDWHELGLFSIEDTRSLMTIPVNYQWEEYFVHAVYEKTGGHPFLIQYVMQDICNHEITDNKIELLKGAEKKVLRNQKVQFENWWNKFDNTAKAIYLRLLRFGSSSNATLASEFGYSWERSVSMLSHTGVVRVNSSATEPAGTIFKVWAAEKGSFEVAPAIADHVDILLKQIERKLRQFIAVHLNKKYKSSWLHGNLENKVIKGIDPTAFPRIIQRAKDDTKVFTNDELLKELYLGDLFNLILHNSEWGQLCSTFNSLSPDPSGAKRKALFEERRDHLVFVRNKLRHVNEDALSENDLLMAQTFTVGLLNDLSLMESTKVG